MESRLQRGRNLAKIDAVKLIKRNMDLVLSFNNSANLLTDARQIIDKTKELAFRSVNVAMLQRNWYLGKRISEEILQGEGRAEYGSQVIISKHFPNTVGTI